MTAEERLESMRNDLIAGQLTTAEIADKYCTFASSKLRDSFISQLETLKYLYGLKRVIND